MHSYLNFKTLGMTRYLLIGLIGFLLVGCNPNEVYNEHFETGEGLQWKKEDSKNFSVDIKEAGEYNVYVTFRYATGYAKDIAPVQLVHLPPNGEENVAPYDLKIRDDKGDYLGEPGYDIWDSKHLVQEATQLAAGTHNFTLATNNGDKHLFPVMDVGLIVEKVAK